MKLEQFLTQRPNTRFHSLVSSRERLRHCLCARRFGRKSNLSKPKYTWENCLDDFVLNKPVNANS